MKLPLGLLDLSLTHYWSVPGVWQAPLPSHVWNLLASQSPFPRHSTQRGEPAQVPSAWHTGKLLGMGKPALQVKEQLLPTVAAGEVVQSMKVPVLNPVMVLSSGGLAHPAVRKGQAQKDTIQPFTQEWTCQSRISDLSYGTMSQTYMSWECCRSHVNTCSVRQPVIGVLHSARQGVGHHEGLAFGPNQCE